MLYNLNAFFSSRLRMDCLTKTVLCKNTFQMVCKTSKEVELLSSRILHVFKYAHVQIQIFHLSI